MRRLILLTVALIIVFALPIAVIFLQPTPKWGCKTSSTATKSITVCPDGHHSHVSITKHKWQAVTSLHSAVNNDPQTEIVFAYYNARGDCPQYKAISLRKGKNTWLIVCDLAPEMGGKCKC